MNLLSAQGDLGREAAAKAARDELSRRQYADARPPLVQRALGWLTDKLDELFSKGTGALGPRTAAVLLVVVIAVVVAVVLVRLGPLGRTTAPARSLFGADAPLTAAGHRAAAEQAATEGRWAEAVRERLRAVVRSLEARGVLDARPGRTAGEVAAEAGAAVPEVADDLRRGARTFDEVWYGGRTADASTYAVLVAVDDRVSAARTAVR
jgi:Domain of unknown function (DUF4129)